MANASTSDFDSLHEKSRSMVCVACYSEAKSGFSSNEIDIVQKYDIDGFEVSNSGFAFILPLFCCRKRRIQISKYLIMI